MTAVDIPTTPSGAAAEINAQMEASFRHLVSNGIKPFAMDEFESFLSAPGTLSQPSLVIRCKIANGDYDIRVVTDKPVSQKRVRESFVPFLRQVISRSSGRSEFFVLISDTLHVSEHKRLECLEHLKNIPFLRSDNSEVDPISTYSILIPDFLVQHKRYGDDLVTIEEAARAMPFEERRDIIMWRGGLNGPEYTNLENYRRFPRYRLALMSAKYPDIIDARLTYYSHADDESDVKLREQLEKELGCVAERLPAASFVSCKYLISVEGVAAGWKRVATILTSGSVLLLHHRWNQFFYPGLKPWIHYVPVEYDLSDLIERYNWLVAHPSEAKIIAENGLRFAREILRPKALETYFLRVLDKCCELYAM